MNPVTPIVYLGEIEENQVYIKRDDLLPFSFGGNKVRIAQEYFIDMKKRGCDCLIGYGNARSNLCRVLANMSISQNIPCHIISPADDNGSRIDTANSFMVNSCGAEIHYCTKNNVAETVQSVIDMCRAKGYKPYYIYGDKTGSGNEATPVRAYAKVFGEIMRQSEEMQKHFDTIFLSTGTGMTQSGLLAGAEENRVAQEIIGISVSRSAEQESGVVRKYLESYLTENEVSESVKNNINVIDSYLCGGYGKYNEGIQKTIKTAFHKYGIPLDPTYSGKGFYGMKMYLREKNLKGKNILFIHTGGTPLFFDYLQNL